VAGIQKNNAIKLKRVAFIIVIGLCALAVVEGVKLGDFEEVLTNASILCLSCIGIG